MLTTDEFSAAIAGATTQLQLVQRALTTIACPPVETLRINLSALSPESIGELLEDVPTGYRKSDRNQTLSTSSGCASQRRHSYSLCGINWTPHAHSPMTTAV